MIAAKVEGIIEGASEAFLRYVHTAELTHISLLTLLSFYGRLLQEKIIIVCYTVLKCWKTQ